jgi:hypothetical protein
VIDPHKRAVITKHTPWCYATPQVCQEEYLSEWQRSSRASAARGWTISIHHQQGYGMQSRPDIRCHTVGSNAPCDRSLDGYLISGGSREQRPYNSHDCHGPSGSIRFLIGFRWAAIPGPRTPDCFNRWAVYKPSRQFRTFCLHRLCVWHTGITFLFVMGANHLDRHTHLLVGPIPIGEGLALILMGGALFSISVKMIEKRDF